MCKILIVDDQCDVRNTLAGFLADHGYSVRVVADEGTALAAVTQEGFDFACVDVRLHDGGEEDESGLSLAMALRTFKSQIRIILFTRYARTNQVVRAIRYYGAVGFVDKGETDWCQQVLETITKVCSEETGQPNLAGTEGNTRLTLSLTTGQPLGIRTQGHFVCSLRSWRVLRIPLERYVRRTELARKDRTNLRFRVEGIGSDLWQDTFVEQPEACNVYLEARGTSQTLSLLFETSREFLRLPLEFIRSENPPDYLLLQHPLSRFIYNAVPRRQAISPGMLALTRELRVLIIASNTKPPIGGVDREAQALCDYLTGQNYIPVRVKLVPTDQATYAQVRQELHECSYDIVHYAGHGHFEPESPEESSLYFWSGQNKQGHVMPMKASALRLLLENSEASLVYLSCCQGTSTGSQVALLNDDFLGLADAIVQAGVPSVLGVRWPVSDCGARRFARAFYESLLRQGSPEIAVWQARRELAQNRNDPTWLSPILIHQQ